MDAHFFEGSAKETKVRFFADKRFPTSQPLACANDADAPTDAWACSVVLGRVHAYPVIRYWDEACNTCSSSSSSSDNTTTSSCAEELDVDGVGRDRGFDYYGGFVLKTIERGPFTRRAFAADVVWSAGFAPYERMLKAMGADLPQGYLARAVLEDASCALEFPWPLFSFNTFNSLSSSYTVNDEQAALENAADWSCTSAYAKQVAAVLPTVNPPVTLLESFYECRKHRQQAALDAAGVAYGNAQLVLVLFLTFVVRQFVRWCFRVSPDSFQHGVLITDQQLQDSVQEMAWEQQYQVAVTNNNNLSSAAASAQQEGDAEDTGDARRHRPEPAAVSSLPGVVRTAMAAPESSTTRTSPQKKEPHGAYTTETRI
mmetsp:Transcript_6636/g.27855  ORF Transcript_6636/g.27855 Transcript_6636/m.27855 type:complete len:371 (-) Transcript_6636:90-1202(-)